MTTLTPSSVDRLLLERERRQRRAQAIQAPTLSTFVERTSGIALEPWQELLCYRLQLLIRQTGQRLLIHGPPQFGKSFIISQRFPAYTLGINPGYRLRNACYNVSHAQRFSRVNLDLMRAPEYLEMFPNPQARVPAVASIEEWSTVARAAKRDANPSFKPLGLGTGFVGLGVDTLIIDDPYKDRMEARSEATNAMLWGWWTDTVLPRFNPDTNVVVMFHRWWEGDFAGRLLERGGWEVLRFPAIADGGADDPTGREIGEPLSPRYSLDYLAAMRVEQGTSFEALYQGTPYPAEGSMFKAGRVGFVDAVPAGATWVRAWDIAASAGKGDYTAGVLMAKAGQRYYVADMVLGQWGTDERDALIRQTAETDRATHGHLTTLFPQDPGQAGKSQALGFTRLLSGFSVETAPVSGDKATRADAFSSQWNAGDGNETYTVALVRAPWNARYLDIMMAFPNGKYDDPVDASADAFNKLAAVGVLPFAWLRNDAAFVASLTS